MTAVPIRAGADPDVRLGAPGAGMVATATTVAARTLRKYMRSPQLLVTSIVAGAIFIVLFRYIFGGAITFGAIPYVDFLIPGMVLTSVLITGTGTAVGVAEDRDQGFFDRLRSLPAPRIALLAGRALGDIIIVAWQPPSPRPWDSWSAASRSCGCSSASGSSPPTPRPPRAPQW